MSAFVDSLNLRPQEKRIIVVIAVIVFVVLNFWFVFPQFKEKGRIETQLRTTRQTIADFQAKIAMDNNPLNGYKTKLKKLQQQEGGAISRSGGDIQLQSTVYEVARKSGVVIGGSDPVNTLHTGTNAATQFFEEQSIAITTITKEENLVKFLYNVGRDSAMIRVKELSLSPADANRYELKCRITLTADYQKAPATKSAETKTEAPLAPTATIKGTNAQKNPAPAGAATKVPPVLAPNTGPRLGPPARGNGPPPFPTMPGPSRAMIPQPGARTSTNGRTP